MWGSGTRRRRLPAALASALPFANRERPLSWAECRNGCRLVATAHGLWEWPDRGSPERHCWREIEEVRCAPGAVTVRAAPSRDPVCEHRLDPDSELPELVRTMESGSRLVELAFRLPSGSRLTVKARTCRFEGTLVWTSRLEEIAGDDPVTDASMARALLERARREYGTVATGPLSA